MKDGELVEARTNQNLYEIFGILTSNKILSVPLYDINTKKYIGFVDMVDIATATVDIIEAVYEEFQKDPLEKQVAQGESTIKFGNNFEKFE